MFCCRNSVFLLWVCLVLSGVAVLPFSIAENTKVGYLKYFLIQETLSVLFCLSFVFSDFCVLFLFSKVAVPPLSTWLELVLEELDQGRFYVLTFAKLVPVFVGCCFCKFILFSPLFLLSFGITCFLKILLAKTTKQILLFVGGLSVISCFFIRFISLAERIY